MNIHKVESHSQTTKLHFKLYKAGKLWLVGAIASGALVAGLSVTTTASAATSEDSDTAAKLAESGTVAQKSVKLVTSSAAPTSSAAEPVHSAAAPASSAAEPVHSAAAPASSTAEPAHSAAAPVSSAAEPAHSAAAPALSTAEQMLYLPNNRLLKMSAPVTEDAPLVKTGTDINGTPVTGALVTTQPHLGNFYVSLGGNKYVPYDSKALVGVVPYDTENFPDTDFPENVYGFYVVLPISISTTLKNVQAGADSYVQALQASVDPSTGIPYINVSKLTVYQLTNTADGRQVFYFKPNDGAQFTKKSGIRGFSNQIHMETLVATASSKDADKYTSLTVNNPSGAPLDTTTTDVLYMGIGDQTYSNTIGGYMSFNAVNLFGSNAADWPDNNLVGIRMNNGAAEADNYGRLDYVSIKVQSRFQVYLSTNPKTHLYSGALYTGAAGEQFNPAKALKTTLDKMYTDRYWYPQYMGTSLANPVAQARPTNALLEPTKLDLSSASDTTPVAGQTYYFYTNYIQTQLNATNRTYYAGDKNGWEPADTLNGLAPDGTPLTVDQAIAGTTPTLGSIIMTITDGNGKTVAQSDLRQPGTYTVKCQYNDAQGNKGAYHSGSNTISTVATSIITVKPAASTLTVTNQAITTGTKWTPSDAITGQTAVDGTPITTPSMGTAADGSKLAVTITDSDGQTLDPTSLDTTTPGTYTLTYTYTDANGNVITPDAVTLTVTAPVNPDNGGNTTTGDTDTSNPTTDPGTTGTGTTMPDKPTKPTTPTKPTKPIVKGVVHIPGLRVSLVVPKKSAAGQHQTVWGTASAKGSQAVGHTMTVSQHNSKSATAATNQ
ncbi:KxYKxGKxW signal peptide domain-containing protein [Levilactobacillus huananensis]|uniref:KxYKxGKxW signal peptide domain-containing protein n=1 Tax=Levilactobacillus huananensis TaxID=2486019 RepID=UPI0013DE0247|nr:KxYKxGKxW signal peptide domain-containing protein [Levilactobacillus huananensis]